MTVIAVALTTLATTSAADAQGAPTLTLSPSSPVPGQTVTFDLTGAPPSSVVGLAYATESAPAASCHGVAQGA